MVAFRWFILAALLLAIGGCQSGKVAVQHAPVSPSPAADATESQEVLLAHYAEAVKREDTDAALIALTTLLRQLPAEATTLNPAVVRRLIYREPANAAGKDIRFQALNALFDASFKMEDGVESGPLWIILVPELVARGDFERAGLVVTRIDLPQAIVWMRVDRRFDALVRKYPKRFDIQTAATRLVTSLEQAVRTHPRSLDAVVQLTYAYLHVGRYADVLSETDTVLGSIVMSGGVDVLYDSATGLQWIYDNRARALGAMGRWDAAEAERRRSADRLEFGRKNVNNTLNLAEFYSNRDRPQDALATLRELPSEDNALSPFGQMVSHYVRLNAAVSMHDDAEIQKNLTYLREHRADNPLVFQRALVRVNASDEAAQLLVSRLQNLSQRQGALMDVQIFVDPPSSPAVEQDRARWQQILARPDVTSAIKSVGRRERFSLPPP